MSLNHWIMYKPFLFALYFSSQSIWYAQFMRYVWGRGHILMAYPSIEGSSFQRMHYPKSIIDVLYDVLFDFLTFIPCFISSCIQFCETMKISLKTCIHKYKTHKDPPITNRYWSWPHNWGITSGCLLGALWPLWNEPLDPHVRNLWFDQNFCVALV